MAHTAVYPGTFDPVTLGHLDVIRRATKVTDYLIVAVADTTSKTPLFSTEERLKLINESLLAVPGIDANIEVTRFDGLLMHFVESRGANLLVRGLRAVSDFEYEFQMASMNHRLNPKVETIFLPASESNQFIASSLVKEIARLGGDITGFVAPAVAQALKERFQ